MAINYREGVLTLEAPDRPPMEIRLEDLEFTPEKEAHVKVYDVFVRVMLLGKKFDEYVTDFIGKDGAYTGGLYVHIVQCPTI